MADKQSRTGLRYADPEIAAYADGVHAPHDEALQAAFASPEQQGLPSIMVGPSEGKLLSVLLGMIHAARVVEIGTLAGYSAIWMARALRAPGKVWSIESEPAHVEAARHNVKRAGLADRVEILSGKALDVLPTLEDFGPFDAVFVDADKEHYDLYAQWAVRNLRRGGLVVGDNGYFFGRLLGADPGARAVRGFHEHVREHCDSVCIPTPDGMVVGIKR